MTSQAPPAEEAVKKKRCKAYVEADGAAADDAPAVAVEKKKLVTKKKSVVIAQGAENGTSAGGYPSAPDKAAATPKTKGAEEADGAPRKSVSSAKKKAADTNGASSSAAGVEAPPAASPKERKSIAKDSKAAVKKRASKHWTKAANDDEGAADPAEPQEAPCNAFAIGEEVVVKIATVMRAQESTESKDVLQLAKGASCRVVEHGEDEGGRRLKVMDLASGQQGWISCVGRSSGNPIIKSAGKSASPAAPAAPAATALPAVPPSSAPLEMVTQPPHAPLPTAPQSSSKAAESCEAVAKTIADAAVTQLPAPAPAPAPAPVATPWGPTRTELIARLFELVDTRQEGRLKLQGLRAYAALCGFSDTEEQWAREYDALCTLYGWNAEQGADVENFAQLIDDEEGAAYCTDEELISVLDEVDQYGVPNVPKDVPPIYVATSPAPALASEETQSVCSSQVSKATKSRMSVSNAVAGALQSVGLRSKPAVTSTPNKNMAKE